MKNCKINIFHNNFKKRIVVKDVDFAIFHSMNIEILQKLKEKNIFIDEIRISKKTSITNGKNTYTKQLCNHQQVN